MFCFVSDIDAHYSVYLPVRLFVCLSVCDMTYNIFVYFITVVSRVVHFITFSMQLDLYVNIYVCIILFLKLTN